MLAKHTLKRVSVIDAAANQLKNLILDGSLEPGRVLTDKELVESWSISRGTLRAAVQDVVRTGLVTQRPNHSAQVRIFTPQYLLDLESPRRVIEGSITADFLSDMAEIPDHLKTQLRIGISAVAAETGVTMESRKLIRDHEISFHSTLVKCLDNKLVSNIYSGYGDAMTACGNQLDVTYNAQRLASDHTELLSQAELTTAGDDPARFEAMMYVHLGDLTLQLSKQF